MSRSQFEDVYELSPMQQGMLFHTLYDPSANIYLEQSVTSLRGQLDDARFSRAWNAVVARHTILRTSFHWEGLQKPVQVVYPAAPLTVGVLDWRGLDAQAQSTRLVELLREDRAKGFDLASPPLLRVTVCRTGDDRAECVLTFQHLLLDRWSRFLVLKEVLAEYAVDGGREISRPAPRPFREYIAWVQRQDRKASEAFWRGALAGFRTPTSLRLDSGVASAATSSPREATLRLSSELSEKLREFARRNRLTLNTLVQGAWAILASRYSSEEDVIFGATVSGRPPELPDVDTMVGLFINTLPVRVLVPGQGEVFEWLKGLQQQLVELRQHEHSSLLDIHGWSEVPRGTPLFESLVVFENIGNEADAEVGRGPLVLERVRSIGGGTNYPLTLMAAPGDRLSFKLQGASSGYDDATLGRMIGHLGNLLGEMAAASPGVRISNLRIVSDAERRQLLDEWNRTDADYPRDATVHGLFEEQAGRRPEALALVCGQERLTYGELNQRANRLARHLVRRGVGPETLVGVCVDRSPEMVVALLGILKAGGAYVPLDAAYPPARLELTLRDAGVPLVVTQEKLETLLPDGSFAKVRVDADRVDIEREAAENPGPRASPESLAYVIYTSGSTGVPKGVAIEHHSTVALLCWAREAYSSHELGGVLASTSICFDLSVFELFAPLSAGGTVILAENALHLPDLPAAGEVRLVNTVPSAIAQLVGIGALPDSVSTVNLAGEPLSTSLVREILRSGRVGRVFDLYGPSEDTTYSTWGLRSPEGPATIGRPLPNKRAYILDSRLEPVPVGVPGDLFVAGAGVARGYLNRPEMTAERFLADPFRPGARMYRTGDRARFLEDGQIQFLGRLDNQVKIRGYRIELGEIEQALSGHPAVNTAVVVARSDDGADKRLVAYVQASGSAPADALELREFLRRSLPAYMLPSQFVSVESFPLTPNGKIDRAALPEPGRIAAAADRFVAPGSPVERALAEMWEEVLRVERVSLGDDFFELGGHSLLATSLVSRIRQHFDMELPLRALFENPTIASLAVEIERERSANLSGTSRAIAPIGRSARRVKSSELEES
ncbi:MAG: amino acid adenylation domain-containing protein [Acidobacteriota bacterium]|nr:amino acid adenylation domain-containing protein [Acidobacteriota bacterium]